MPITIPENANLASLAVLAGVDPLAVTCDGDQLTANGVTQSQLEAALAAYLADEETHLLKPAREARSRQFAQQVIREIEARYAASRREVLLALYVEATATGLTNRAAYINGLLSWIKQTVALCVTFDAGLAAAGSYAEIGAVDDGGAALQVILDNDPETTVAACLAIHD